MADSKYQAAKLEERGAKQIAKWRHFRIWVELDKRKTSNKAEVCFYVTQDLPVAERWQALSGRWSKYSLQAMFGGWLKPRKAGKVVRMAEDFLGEEED